MPSLWMLMTMPRMKTRRPSNRAGVSWGSSGELTTARDCISPLPRVNKQAEQEEIRGANYTKYWAGILVR